MDPGNGEFPFPVINEFEVPSSPTPMETAIIHHVVPQITRADNSTTFMGFVEEPSIENEIDMTEEAIRMLIDNFKNDFPEVNVLLDVPEVTNHLPQQPALWQPPHQLVAPLPQPNPAFWAHQPLLTVDVAATPSPTAAALWQSSVNTPPQPAGAFGWPLLNTPAPQQVGFAPWQHMTPPPNSSRWVEVLWPTAAALLQPQQRVPGGMPTLPAAAAAEAAIPFNSVFSCRDAAASNTAQPPNNINTFMPITPGPSVPPPFPGPSTKMLTANMEAFENKGKEVVNGLTGTHEIHNLTEKKRKDRINNNMKILQDLINCPGKMDKTSVLSLASDYIKKLQESFQGQMEVWENFISQIGYEMRENEPPIVKVDAFMAHMSRLANLCSQLLISIYKAHVDDDDEAQDQVTPKPNPPST